jgi:hypothetical protein
LQRFQFFIHSAVNIIAVVIATADASWLPMNPAMNGTLPVTVMGKLPPERYGQRAV